MRTEIVVAHAARERAEFRDALRFGEFDHGALMRPATHEHTVHIVAPDLVAQRGHRADEVVDAILHAHLAEIDEQVRLALFPRGVGRVARET